ncbi:MAG: restriction endonuclease subunit S [Candidatus Omnitrophota bacterium]
MVKNKKAQPIPCGWSIVPVGKIFSYVKSYALSREKLNYGLVSIGNVGNIHYGDIHSTFNSSIISLDDTLVPIVVENTFHPSTEDLLKDGDLVMADASEDYEGVATNVLVRGLNSKKVVGGLHTFVLRGKPDATLKSFRQYIFSNPTIRRHLQKVANGVSVYSISKYEVSKVQLLLPPLPEQKRIVAVLEAWDGYLRGLDRKIEIKKNIKKGLMQQLLTGKKRLKGFCEKWEIIKLKSMGEIVTGNTPPMKDKSNYGSDYCWATADDFKSKYIKNTEVKLSEIGKNLSRWLPKGSLLITCIASIGKNAIAAVPLATNQQINSIIVNEKYNNEFLFYLINNSLTLLRKFAGAGAMPILNKNDFSDLRLNVPKLKKEQDAIADILTKADAEIEALEKKRGVVAAQKKYLLNKLITGEIRTPEDLLDKVKNYEKN